MLSIWTSLKICRLVKGLMESDGTTMKEINGRIIENDDPNQTHPNRLIRVEIFSSVELDAC